MATTAAVAILPVVSSDQRKERFVVKGRGFPGGRGVAFDAIGAKVIDGFVFLMTVDTIGR